MVRQPSSLAFSLVPIKRQLSDLACVHIGLRYINGRGLELALDRVGYEKTFKVYSIYLVILSELRVNLYQTSR